MVRALAVEDLVAHFRLPFQEAAVALGVCQTSLKKLCRKHGITRWPQRKLKGIDRKIANLTSELVQFPSGSQEGAVLRNQLLRLENTREEICNLRSAKNDKSESDNLHDFATFTLASSDYSSHSQFLPPRPPVLAFPASSASQPAPSSYARAQSFAPQLSLPTQSPYSRPVYSQEQYPTFPRTNAFVFKSEPTYPSFPSRQEQHRTPEESKAARPFAAQPQRPRISVDQLCSHPAATSGLPSPGESPSTVLSTTNTPNTLGQNHWNMPNTPCGSSIKEIDERLANWGLSSPGPNLTSRYLPEPDWDAVRMPSQSAHAGVGWM